MKNYSLLLLFVTMASFGQIRFEPGYIITPNGERKECLVKNVDWKNNPTDVVYRFENSDQELTADVNSIKEFGVEFRLSTRNDLLNDYLDLLAEYSKFSFIVGYKIFEVKTRK